MESLDPRRPAIALAAPVLEYGGSRTRLDQRYAPAAGWLLAQSILSGFCIAACFGALAWRSGSLLLIVFGVMALTGIVTARQLYAVCSPSRVMIALEGLATIGLLGIAANAVAMSDTTAPEKSPLMFGICFSFLMLAAATPRHRLLYDLLAEWCASGNTQGFGGRLRRLGWVKMIYEGIWLCCCAATAFGANSSIGSDYVFIGIAALLGIGGYFVIWVWMIVAHARLHSMTRR